MRRYLPPLKYIVNAAMSGVACVGCYAAGYPTTGHMLAVMTVMGTLGASRMAVASDIAIWLRPKISAATARAKTASTAAAVSHVCPECVAGQIVVPADCDDDNCCPGCAGTGIAQERTA